MVCTNNKKYYDSVNLLKNLGFTKTRFVHKILANNFRMSGMQAALGLSQLNEIEKINARLDKLESTLLDIKDHLGLLSNTDKLNMLTNDKELKKDSFTGKLQEANWYVYMLECNDKSIYTGICKNDINRRMKEHQSGKGSKYVRSRLPFKLVWSKGGFTASEALKEEYRIKQLEREDKRKIWLK